MASYFWIAIGSALGGMARYWCSGVAARLIGETFPWGTLIVNVIGSFIIGFFATLTGPDGRLGRLLARQFVMIGICGGYTTFSSFSLQTLNLASDGEYLYAGLNIAALGRAVPSRGLARQHPRRAPQRAEMGVTMQIPHDAVLLRIFFGEDDDTGTCHSTKRSC